MYWFVAMDTVATDEEDDEINADDHAWEHRAAIRHDAVVHDHIPVLTCQDLTHSNHQGHAPSAGDITCCCHDTWKQVSSACGKASKVLRLVCVSSKLNFPPNSCMPSRAKMMRKRKRSSSREAMDFMEFSREATRLDRAVQWLRRHMDTIRNQEFGAHLEAQV